MFRSLREYILKLVDDYEDNDDDNDDQERKNLDIKSVSRGRTMIQVLRFIPTARARHVTRYRHDYFWQYSMDRLTPSFVSLNPGNEVA